MVEYDKFSSVQKHLIDLVVELADILSVRQYSQQEVEFGNVKRFGEIVENTNQRIDKCLNELCLFIESRTINKLREMIE